MHIDPAFLTTSHALAELPVCHVRLQDDARFPWVLLLPRADGARELEDLAESQRPALFAEIVQAGEAVRAIGRSLGRPVEKLNVGALGNVTPQLHIHVIGRRADDPAWPGPAWGAGEPAPYAGRLAAALAAGRLAFAESGEAR